MFWVYILENSNGKLYVGQTKELAARLLDHNRADRFEGHYTRKNGPWKLVWQEAHDSRSSAMLRERQIKRMKSAKWIRTNLLASDASAVNPDKSGL
jgi:putative endonuclease